MCFITADVLAGSAFWYLPYVFFYYEHASTTFHEIYGYPKQMSFFDHSSPSTSRTTTTVFKPQAIAPTPPTTRLTATYYHRHT